MSGIPVEDTDGDGNVVLPSISVSGTGVEGDRVTKDGTTYDSTAGSYGAFGPQISNYSNLTEANVREILGASIGASDAWTNAWNGLCDLIAQFPFVRDILAFGGNVSNGAMQLLGGIQNLADAACAMLLGEQTYTANVTSVSATSTRITFTIATAANHQLPASVDTNTSFTVSGLSNNKYNGAFKVISVTRGSTQSTVVCASTAGALPATAMSGTFTIRTTPTSLLGGVAAIVANILSLFGLDKLPDLITWIGEQITCWWNTLGGAFFAVEGAVANTITGVLGQIGNIFSTVLGFFGSNQTIREILTWIGEQVTCWWNALGGVATMIGGTVANTIKAIFGQLGNILSGFLSVFEQNTLIHNVVDLFINLFSKLGVSIWNGVQYVLVNFPSVTQVFAFFQNIIDFFWNTFSWFLGGPVAQAGKTLFELVSNAWTWIGTTFGDLLSGAGSIVMQITSWITGVATQFISNPVAALTSFFTGVAGNGATLLYNIVNGVAVQLGQSIDSLLSWATGLLGLNNAYDWLKSVIGNFIGSIPIGNIAQPETKPNLLSLGEFTTAASIQALNGWSWDSSREKNSGNVGGVAKLNCAATSGIKQLYSNQNIKVNVGDQLGIKAWIQTADSFDGISNSIVLSVVPFAGTVQKPTIPLAWRGASGSWVELSNEVSPFTAWTVPKYTSNPSGFGNTAADQITSVQVKISVNANYGTVWFDDIRLYKTGLMQQGLVDNLPSAFGGLIDGLSGNTIGTTSSATGSATNMHQAATNPAGAAAVAGRNAGTALTNVKNTVDGIAQTVGGLSGAVDQNPLSVSTHFASFFNKLYGAGNSTPQDTVPQGSINTLPQAFAGLYDGFRSNAPGTTSTYSGTYSGFQNAFSSVGGAVNTATSNASQAQTTGTNANTQANYAAAANNLIISADFEDSTVVRGIYTRGTVEYSTATKYSGTQCLKMTCDATGYANLRLSSNRENSFDYKNWVQCRTGETYYFSAAIFPTQFATSVTFQPTGHFEGGTSGNMPNTSTNWVTLTAGAWNLIHCTFTVPSDRKYSSMLPYLEVISTPNTSVYLDVVVLRLASPFDISITQTTAGRAVGLNAFPMGYKVSRPIEVTKITYRCGTADFAGSSTFELRKNGSSLPSTTYQVPAASQVSGVSLSGKWEFAAGDIITVYTTAVGSIPGGGLVAELSGCYLE